MVDALTVRGDEGRIRAAISLGELPKSFDPRISEWGNPAYRDICYPTGSEPGEVKHLSSQRKRKSNEIPIVAASELGLGQTQCLHWGCRDYNV